MRQNLVICSEAAKNKSYSQSFHTFFLNEEVN